MEKKISIMIAEDHVSVRQGYAFILKAEKQFEITGEASNGLELLKKLRQNPPDIVISDIEMPQMNGFELAKIIKTEFPAVKLIYFTMHYSDYFIAQMIRDGASAFIPKAANIEVLIEAIYGVYKDGFYFNKTISQLLVSSLIAEKKLNSMLKQLALSHRETQILKLICDGKTNKEIGKSIGIEACTVDFHRQNIYKKTNSGNIVSLVKYAIKNGITSVDDQLPLNA